MTIKRTQAKKKLFVNDPSIEAIRGMGKGVLDQLFGSYDSNEKQKPQPLSGDLVEGQELSLQKAETSFYREPSIDYRKEILQSERKIAQENTQIIEAKIQEIIVELKRLTQTSKIIQAEFRKVTVEQRIAKPGKYHLSFFEWILSVVRSARIKVEDSASWLAVFKSKKAQRQYWNMFKKHGTTFGLSNERIVATQTG